MIYVPETMQYKKHSHSWSMLVRCVSSEPNQTYRANLQFMINLGDRNKLSNTGKKQSDKSRLWPNL